MDSTLTQHAIKSGAAWLASADAQIRDRFLNELTEGGPLALPYLFEFWAHPLAGLTWISEPETLAAFERALGVIGRFKSELYHMNKQRRDL